MENAYRKAQDQPCMVSFGICMQALCLVVLWLAMEPAGLADLYSCHITSEYLGLYLSFP